MRIKFKKVWQIEEFAKHCTTYNSDIIIKDGSIMVDGESLVGLLAIGINKVVDVNIILKDESLDNIIDDLLKLGIKAED